MRAGILWPPPSQPFHSGGSPGLKCTPGQQQTWGWTAAACWPGYSGLSAETHKPPSDRVKMWINHGVCPFPGPPLTVTPRTCPCPHPSGVSSHPKLPRTKLQKESHPSSPAKTTPGHKKRFCCLFAQISGIRGSRVWSSSLHLPPFHFHQLSAVIKSLLSKSLSTVSPQGRMIISCAQNSEIQFSQGRHLPFRATGTGGDFVLS